jgi:hypothetical protein
MPIAQIWKYERVSSPFILESVECNMCERQNKNRDAYGMASTQQRELYTVWAGAVRPGLQAG